MKLPVMKKALQAVALLSVFATCTVAQADGGFKLKVKKQVGNTTIKVKSKVDYDIDGGWRYVKSVKVKVNGQKVRSLKFEANGSSFVAPCAADYCEVTLGQTLRSFSIYNPYDTDLVLGGIEWLETDHVLDHYRVPACGGSLYFGQSLLTSITNVIALSDAFQGYVHPTAYLEFILPIKVVAGRAYAMAMGRGEVSMKTGAAVQAVIAQIDFANDFIASEMQIDATFGLATQLLTAREQIADMID